jgi:uncharacterized protein (DUF983 family)
VGPAAAVSGVRGLWRVCLARALRRRCPQCGAGRLFERGFRLHRACSACGLVYRREQGAMTGSMYLSAAVTELFAAGVIAVVWLATDWGVALSIAIGLPLVGAFCWAFQPYSMALWVAVEYLTDAGNREPWVRPRVGEREGGA